MTGKDKCRTLRRIRETVAKANGIEYNERDCGHTGPCRGTCAYCEAQARELERELKKRSAAGRRIAVAGLCAGLVLAASGCSGQDMLAMKDAAGPLKTPEPPAIEQPSTTGLPLPTDDLSGYIAAPEPTPEDDLCTVEMGEVMYEPDEQP